MQKNMFFKNTFGALVVGALAVVPTACSDDDNVTVVPNSEVKFAITVADAEKDLAGGAYIKVLSNLDDVSRRDLVIYGDSTNPEVTRSYDGYIRTDYNHNTQILAAHIYGKGASDLGLGKRASGFRSYKFDGTKFTEIAATKVDRTGGAGVYGNYVFSTQGSAPVVDRVDGTGKTEKLTLDFSNYLVNGANPTLFGITDLGNNQVAIALDYADRDSFAVGFCGYDLKNIKVVWSTKAGHSAAARKAQKYNQLVADAAGNLYAFGGTAKSDGKVGAARIPAGTQAFDDYYFDLFAASDGYRIRKVYHVTDDKFLLEFYEDKGPAQNVDNPGRMAIADMSDKKLTWVSGLPNSLEGLHVGFGAAYNGKFYLPISTATGLLPKSATTTTPTVYAIDANTGKATVFLTLKAGQVVKSINFLTK